MAALIASFGTSKAGASVHRAVLDNGELRVAFLSYGATVQSVLFSGQEMTVGGATMADYEGRRRVFGALVGPVANRIGYGRGEIHGVLHRFEVNRAPHMLHGASAALHLRVWNMALEGETVVFRITCADGEAGFPGNREIIARYRLGGSALELEIEGRTDQPTLMNIANHSYWNLGGNFADHHLQIDADHYLPTDDTSLPTGEISDVSGTPYDFREGRRLMEGVPPLDHNFCLATGGRAVLSGPSARMTVETDAPGLQVYDAATQSPNYCGLALEAQHWPDAPNHADFPTILVQPDEVYRQKTRWIFA
ncbi:aldose epimerase family protein [Cognatishimia sp. MH4019]|uniref:aldose epimerase family protein n=1 Tax=Cognatishimia sp. MH4019 TaxID=2854030 RepID=UPI001CD610CE|nr:aldose epimerase family protein [Cognatishimia sp. MH4019]